MITCACRSLLVYFSKTIQSIIQSPLDIYQLLFMQTYPTGTRVEQYNMVYMIDYTNLTSTQKTGAIARMQQCYNNDIIINENLQMFLDIFASETVSSNLV